MSRGARRPGPALGGAEVLHAEAEGAEEAVDEEGSQGQEHRRAHEADQDVRRTEVLASGAGASGTAPLGGIQVVWPTKAALSHYLPISLPTDPPIYLPTNLPTHLPYLTAINIMTTCIA